MFRQHKKSYYVYKAECPIDETSLSFSECLVYAAIEMTLSFEALFNNRTKDLMQCLTFFLQNKLLLKRGRLRCYGVQNLD